MDSTNIWLIVGGVASILTILGGSLKVAHALGSLQGTITSDLKVLKKCQETDHTLLLKHDKQITKLNTILEVKGVD